jgi:hypothetical protein
VDAAGAGGGSADEQAAEEAAPGGVADDGGVGDEAADILAGCRVGDDPEDAGLHGQPERPRRRRTSPAMRSALGT